MKKMLAVLVLVLLLGGYVFMMATIVPPMLEARSWGALTILALAHLIPVVCLLGSKRMWREMYEWV